LQLLEHLLGGEVWGWLIFGCRGLIFNRGLYNLVF
jgi:hypothetical protein